jgi:hypothetical protein
MKTVASERTKSRDKKRELQDLSNFSMNEDK